MTVLQNLSLSRRDFVSRSLASGTALVLGFTLPATGWSRAAAGAMWQDPTQPDLTAFISISAKNRVTVFCPFIEMGQGTYTAIPMLVAEELGVSLDRIDVVQAPHGPEYKIMFNNSARFTGGSYSVRASFLPLRQAGAAARHMLRQAAANRWQTDAGTLVVKNGVISDTGGGRQLAFGELVGEAAKLPVPQDVTLKDAAEFTLLGTPAARLDVKAKTNGSAEFGIDYRLPGMITAAVKQSPVFNGKPARFDSKAVLSMPGVIAVENIPNGIAVVADHYWHAKTALDKLPVTFAGGIDKAFSSAGYLEKLRSRLDDRGVPAEQHGDTATAFSQAYSTHSADYHAPFLAHATMEPMNCTALVSEDACVVWTPNQGVDIVAATAARLTGLPLEQITVNTPYLGGGFGRRFTDDYVEQAVVIAMKHRNTPVKVIWSREEDMQHDFYRPMTAARYRAAIDSKGNITGLHVTTAGDGPSRRHAGKPLADDALDRSVVEGATEQPYRFDNVRHDYVYEYASPPIGYWRSVGNSHNAFFKESFIDELAHATKTDPVQFRRGLLAGNDRFLNVLERTVKMAGWRQGSYTNSKGQKCAMGVALHRSFNTIVCQVAEVTVLSGKPRINHVWCVVDCGFAVNPRIVTMQMESGIAFGLSAALHEEIVISEGRTMKNNFDDYPILTAREMPAVDVEIINSGADPGGIGEPGTPPIAPALCNALFTLTGKRVRSLPVRSA